MRGRTRKGILFGSITAGGVLAAASAAFACTIFLGTMTVYGTAPGSSGTSTAVGNGTGMGYCSSTSGAQVARTGGVAAPIHVHIDSAGSCGNLPNGPYNVTYFPDRAVDCMTTAFGIPVGVINVNGGQGDADVVIAGGNSSPTGSVLGTGPTGGAAVCVSDQTGFRGNQVSVTII